MRPGEAYPLAGSNNYSIGPGGNPIGVGGNPMGYN